MREREIRAHETTVNVMQTFELGMKQGHWLKSFNRWEISALSPHHLESQPSQFSQDWRDSRITFTAKTKTLPGKQGQVDYPTTILLFLISSSKTVAYLTSCFKVALATLWLSFFFFFLSIPDVGEWVSDHLHKTSCFPLYLLSSVKTFTIIWIW